MANELIAVTLSVFLERAIAMAADGCGLMMGFLDDLKIMEGFVKEIQVGLADAEAKQSRHLTALRWLKNAEGAAFEAENVLDELLYERVRRQVYEIKGGAVAKVCSLFSLAEYDISFRMRMGSRVRGINEKLKNIVLEDHGRNSLLLRDGNFTFEAVRQQSSESNSLPYPFVVGRVKEESEIVDMLLLGSSDNNVNLPILPIVGMGGLGKTTLAKSIYNNGRIIDWFSIRIWICVSETFEVANILRLTWEALSGERVDLTSLDAIVHGIQKKLSGKRFLFVLDDVWNEDKHLWDSFITSLVGPLSPARGSCCILTSRLEKNGQSCVYLLHPLCIG